MLARGLIEFIVGAMVGGGMFLYSPNSNIESVVFAGAVGGLVLSLLLAFSSRMFGWFEKFMKFLIR